MTSLLLIIVCLYIVYQFVGKYLLPRISERRLRRYQQQFFQHNPHIDSDEYQRRKKDQQDNAPLMTKRKDYRI